MKKKWITCVFLGIAAACMMALLLRRPLLVEVYLWELSNCKFDRKLSAAAGLADIRTQRAISGVCDLFAMDASDPGIRRALTYMGVDAVPCLIKSLADKDEERRVTAAAILRSLGADASAAAGPLEQALGDPNALVRYWAAYAFSEIDEVRPEAVGRLKSLAASDSDEDVRQIAEYVLQNRGLDVE